MREVHQRGEFRIFYALSGLDALPNIEDSDRDGTPDYVDRVATDLAAARAIYEQEMHLRHPLKSPRYKNQAEFIDVHLLGFPLTTNGPKHGIAYDELSSFDRSRDAGRKVRVLVMDISNDLSPKNATPAHELFHLYQNGYTFFKNRWFTEGTARWAEAMGKKSSAGTGQLPRSLSDVNDLFQKTYETAPFWGSVAYRMDPVGGGRGFIKAFFEELGRLDDVAGVSNAQASEKWSEKDQMSRANDAYIWKALQNTLEQPAFRERWDGDIQRLMQLKL